MSGGGNGSPGPRRSPRQFFAKYFLQGQTLSRNVSKLEDLHSDADFMERFVVRHRRCLGILLPLGLFHIVYWCVFFRHGLLEIILRRYPMMIVMIFGGFVGGATTAGGGAIAYPVMTLGFNISSNVASDFSFMVQSCGLSCASFAIFFMGVQVEWRSLVFSTAGAIPALLLSMHFLDPLLSNAQKKMIFVSFFFAFAMALFYLNTKKKRVTFHRIPKFGPATALVLLGTGFIGGIFTGIAGSGIDVYSFSVLTLLFRISEKVATPTAVVLMAANSIVGFFWRAAMMCNIQRPQKQQELVLDFIKHVDRSYLQEAWEYFTACAIVVATFAPVGSLFASHVHRQTLAVLIYILETAALVGALLIVDLTPALVALTIGVITTAFLFYFMLSRIGDRLIPEESLTTMETCSQLLFKSNTTPEIIES